MGKGLPRPGGSVGNKGGWRGATNTSSEERGGVVVGSGKEPDRERDPADEAPCGQQGKSLTAGNQDCGG